AQKSLCFPPSRLPAFPLYRDRARSRRVTRYDLCLRETLSELLEGGFDLRELRDADAAHDRAGLAQPLLGGPEIAALDQVIAQQRERARRLLLVSDLAEGVDAREEALLRAPRDLALVVEERLR